MGGLELNRKEKLKEILESWYKYAIFLSYGLWIPDDAWEIIKKDIWRFRK